MTHGAQSWAADINNRNTVGDTLTWAYYGQCLLNTISYYQFKSAMYALILLFAFILLPLAYFFFEEKDDDKRTSTGKVIEVTACIQVVDNRINSASAWPSATPPASSS